MKDKGQMPDAVETKPRIKRGWFWALGGVVVLGVAAVLYWQPFTPKATTVTVETMAEAQATRVLAVNGKIAALTSVSVRSSVSGSLQATMAVVGQRVAEGEVLAAVDASQQQAVVRQAQSALAQGILKQSQAGADYARLRDLGTVTARTAVEAAQSSLAQAAQNVESLKALLDQAQIQMNRYTIKAPMAGVIMLRGADPGQYIDPSLSLFTMSDLSALVVETNVDEAYATQVSLGQTVALELVGTTRTLPGKVSFVAPRVDPSTGGLEVKIAPDAPLTAPVGLTVTANIVVDERSAALTIPRTAMVSGPAVFLMKGAKAVKTPVEVIDWPAARLIVTKGLAVGDVVIVDATGLKDGALVKVGG